MSSFLAQTSDVLAIEAFLTLDPALSHLRVRGEEIDLLTLSPDPPKPHDAMLGLGRVTVHLLRTLRPPSLPRSAQILLEMIVGQSPG